WRARRRFRRHDSLAHAEEDPVRSGRPRPIAWSLCRRQKPEGESHGGEKGSQSDSGYQVAVAHIRPTACVSHRPPIAWSSKRQNRRDPSHAEIFALLPRPKSIREASERTAPLLRMAELE